MDIVSTLQKINAAAESSGFMYHEMGRAGEWVLPALTRPRPERPRIYLSAGMHGDEPAGVEALLELLRDGFFDDRASWSICPLLNPTGLQLGTRENAAGLDLNREYRRTISPEITAHTAWLRAQSPHSLSLSLHEDWETSGFYLYEINTSGHPWLGRGILRAVEEVMPLEPGRVLDGHEVTDRGYITHPPEADDPVNWPEAIFLARLWPQLSCTFETPSRAAGLEQRVRAQTCAVRAAVDLFLAGQ